MKKCISDGQIDAKYDRTKVNPAAIKKAFEAKFPFDDEGIQTDLMDVIVELANY